MNPRVDDMVEVISELSRAGMGAGHQQAIAGRVIEQLDNTTHENAGIDVPVSSELRRSKVRAITNHQRILMVQEKKSECDQLRARLTEVVDDCWTNILASIQPEQLVEFLTCLSPEQLRLMESAGQPGQAMTPRQEQELKSSHIRWLRSCVERMNCELGLNEVVRTSRFEVTTPDRYL